MMTTLDRMLFANYLRSYFIVLASLLSLYVVIDLFMNLDDFTKGSFADSVVHIRNYYAANVAKIFDLLSGFLGLSAALFTVAWMQRSNELLPQLSAGIPTRRVIRPILIGCFLTVMLGPVNQELVIPAVAGELMKPRNDPNLERAVSVNGAFDRSGVHIEGYAALKNERKIIRFEVTFSGGQSVMTLSADEAVYIPANPNAAPNELTGGWLLSNAKPEKIEGTLPNNLVALGVGRYFLLTTDINFDAVTRAGNWYMYASAGQLRELLARPDPKRQPAVAVSYHRRFTRPILGMILILVGLGVVLRDQNKNVFLNVGTCIAISGLFYAVDLGCKYLGENDFVSPPLAAWLPVLIFGPYALVQFDAIQT